MYTKLSRLIVDLTNIDSNVHLSSKAENMVERITELHKGVTAQIEKMNQAYKSQVDKHRRFKEFKEGELVMIHLRKARLPIGKYNKLQSKKLGPYPIIKKFGDNAYKIDLPDHIHINLIFNVADIFEYFPPDQLQLSN